MNPVSAPAYPVAEAAKYLRLPAATLRSWVRGRSYPRAKDEGYFEPLIHLPQGAQELSFANLIEAHVLRALRQEHAVSIQAVRNALEYAQRQFNLNRLLLSRELMTTAGQLFLKRYGEQISLSQSGQIAMSLTLEDHLKRVEWDNADFPRRLYPFISGTDDPKVIVIDPRIAFGRPVTIRNSISTATIVDRIDAGESMEELAEDYDLKPEDIKAAILYERRAA